MKYMLLIHQGTTPTPRDPEAWASLSEDEQNQVYADYQKLNQTPGVTPGQQLADPGSATTVRVQDGNTLVTDGPFVETKEAVGGFDLLECDSFEQAVEIAANHPIAEMGAIEVRPLWGN